LADTPGSGIASRGDCPLGTSSSLSRLLLLMTRNQSESQSRKYLWTLELCRNSSSTLIPPTNHHSYHCHYQPAPCTTLPQNNQSPTMLHTCSMSQANHIAHAPVLKVMGFGCHKDLQGFESAFFGTLQSMSLFVICSILQPYALPIISLYVYVFLCINTPVCCMYFISLKINLTTYFS